MKQFGKNYAGFLKNVKFRFYKFDFCVFKKSKIPKKFFNQKLAEIAKKY